MQKWIGITGMLALVMTMHACKKDKQETVPQQTLQLQFNHRFGTAALALNTAYTTPLSEPFTPTKFKYYVTNLSAIQENGTEVKLPDYTLLIDEAVPASKTVDLKVPANQRYKEIRFLLGVDSARNVSGVQSGALDPVNGMFWTWNTGYIMAKLEGKSSISPAPLQGVTYHIGGFRTGESVLKKISLAFPAPVSVTEQQAYRVVVYANAATWFKSVHDVSITTMSSIMEPGPAAQKIADNYARMFSVVSVSPL